MRKLLFFSAALFWAGVASCQHVSLGYFGETVTHYGVKGGIGFTIEQFDKEKRNGRLASHSFSVAPSLAIYRHAHNHVGLILMPDVTYGRQNHRDGIFEAGISPGLFRSFLEGKTYEVIDGELQRKKLAGRTAFMPAVFAGFGKNLAVTKNIPLSWYCRAYVMKQVPYNASSLTRFAVELGIVKPITF